MSYAISKVASIDTPLTCNCLLPRRDSPWQAETYGDSLVPYALHAASYELCPASPSSSPASASCTAGPDDGEASGAADSCHVGECATYACLLDAENAGATAECRLRASTTVDGAPSLPGVFDLLSVPARFFSCGGGTASAVSSPMCLVLACTDGSVRVVDPDTLSSVVEPFTGIHAEMITSCTPLYHSSGSGGGAAAHLLCSAHTGAVLLYSLAERRVVQQLEGHQYDAWCTAVFPMGGWWTAAAPPASSGSDDEMTEKEEEDGASAAAVPSSDALLVSGGDDGLCKLYDVRCRCRRAVAKARCEAGVVSVSPVMDTASNTSVAASTPYMLVGSYDESISLFDVRALRRPVAQRGGLGGGVWRTSRCLHPLFPESSPAPAAEANTNAQLMLDAAVLGRGDARGTTCGWVNTSNVLVLPLMQRGAALLPYDVRAAAGEVFGDAPLQHLYREEEEEEGEEEEGEEGARGDAVTPPLPTLTERSLIYDTAVLRPLARENTAAAAAVVATASFYEKRIDLWTVRMSGS